MPASVTVSAGATSASFTITTTSVAAATSATISAVFAGVTRAAVLTLNPPAPPPGQAVTLTVTATGRKDERGTSNPTGINVAVGNTGSASFATGTSITLRATNSRDVIWSGACSSGGKKTKTCTFTIGANAAVRQTCSDVHRCRDSLEIVVRFGRARRRTSIHSCID